MDEYLDQMTEEEQAIFRAEYLLFQAECAMNDLLEDCLKPKGREII